MSQSSLLRSQTCETSFQNYFQWTTKLGCLKLPKVGPLQIQRSINATWRHQKRAMSPAWLGMGRLSVATLHASEDSSPSWLSAALENNRTTLKEAVLTWLIRIDILQTSLGNPLEKSAGRLCPKRCDGGKLRKASSKQRARGLCRLVVAAFTQASGTTSNIQRVTGGGRRLCVCTRERFVTQCVVRGCRKCTWPAQISPDFC